VVVDRVAGLETEYGCLVSGDGPRGLPDVWPTRVKNYLFRERNVGAIDQHYRDYEEPPGNGGFLLNGGRIYLDMGHIEYASPECLSLRDVVAYDLAGDDLLQSALNELGVANRVSFIKNNVDHYTGATFGCHENYLMRREAQFTPAVLGALLAFLATRQLFTGAGRVGQAHPLALEVDLKGPSEKVDFQISQRADYIVNDIYQWVQFNRAIINARDEPLADYRKYRRLHLLIGDSNISPFATALKVGTTACVLSLLERGSLPRDLTLADSVQSTRDISRSASGEWIARLENGKTMDAIDVQWRFFRLAQKHLTGRDAETDWILESWNFVLEALESNHGALIGGVDWITKKWLLDMLIEAEGLAWDDPWLQSIDLEYHNIAPAKGLFFGVKSSKRIDDWNQSVRRSAATTTPPNNTRAAGRARAVEFFQKRSSTFIINWDSIATEGRDFLLMGDPFQTYEREVSQFLAQRSDATSPDG